VAAARRDRAAPVGAGTVPGPAQVTDARDAGAAFTVSPGFDPGVVDASRAAGLPSLPGVATATDIQRALRHGLRRVKDFPASALGEGWFAAMRPLVDRRPHHREDADPPLPAESTSVPSSRPSLAIARPGTCGIGEVAKSRRGAFHVF